MGRSIIAALLLALLTTGLSSPTTLTDDDTASSLFDKMTYLLRELQRLITKAKLSFLPAEQALSDPSNLGESLQAEAITTLGSDALLVFGDEAGSGDGDQTMSVGDLGKGLLDQVSKDTLYESFQDAESSTSDTNDVDALMREEEMLLVKKDPPRKESLPTSPPVVAHMTSTQKGTSRPEMETAEDEMTTDQLQIMTTSASPVQETESATKEVVPALAATTKTLEDTTVVPFEHATEDIEEITQTHTVEGKTFTSPTAGFKEILNPTDATEKGYDEENMAVSPSMKSNVLADSGFETYSTVSSQEMLTEVMETLRGVPATKEAPQVEARNTGPEVGVSTNVVGGDGDPTPSSSRTEPRNPYALGSNGPTYAPRIVKNERFWTPRCTRPGLYLPHPYNPCMFMRCSLFPEKPEQPPALLAQSYWCGKGTGVPPWFFSGNAIPCIIRDSRCK